MWFQYTGLPAAIPSPSMMQTVYIVTFDIFVSENIIHLVKVYPANVLEWLEFRLQLDHFRPILFELRGVDVGSEHLIPMILVSRDSPVVCDCGMDLLQL